MAAGRESGFSLAQNDILTFVAEDDDDVRDLLVADLDAMGAGALAAPDGAALVTLMEANPGPAVVFLDIHMPEKDGIEVLRSLAAERRPMVLYFVTGSAGVNLNSAKVIAQALGLTVGGVLLKPFSASELRTALTEGRAMIAGAQ